MKHIIGTTEYITERQDVKCGDWIIKNGRAYAADTWDIDETGDVVLSQRELTDADKPFTKESCIKLQAICRKIDYLMAENVDGALMASQMMMLGEAIKGFVEHPIILTSGLLPK